MLGVDDRVRVISDCADKGRTGVIVKVDRSDPPFTHEVRLDDPDQLDEMLAGYLGTDLVPYAETELELENV